MGWEEHTAGCEEHTEGCALFEGERAGRNTQRAVHRLSRRIATEAVCTVSVM